MKEIIHPFKPAIGKIELIILLSSVLGIGLPFIYFFTASIKSDVTEILIMLFGTFAAAMFIVIIHSFIPKLMKIKINDHTITYGRKKMDWNEVMRVTVTDVTTLHNGFLDKFERLLVFKDKNKKTLKIPFYQKNVWGEVAYQYDFQSFKTFLAYIEQRFNFRTGAFIEVYQVSETLMQQQIDRGGFPYPKAAIVAGVLGFLCIIFSLLFPQYQGYALTFGGVPSVILLIVALRKAQKINNGNEKNN